MMRLYSVLFARIFSRSGDIYVLKVVTLAIAFSVSIVVTLFSINEFEYDTGYENSADVFRLLASNTDKNYTNNRLSASIPDSVLNRLSNQIGHVSTISRIKSLKRVTVITNGNQPAYDQKIHAADPTINEIFAFSIVDGDILNFKRSKSVAAIISKSTAARYFGDKSAVGQTIELTTFGDTLAVEVAAVFRDLPVNTHEDFNIFINYDSSAVATLHFVPTQSGVYIRGNSEIGNQSFAGNDGDSWEYILQPVEDIYFGPRVLSEEARHGDIYSVAVLICVASLIFLLAICSFINLSTITLPNRSKEIAVKKLTGKTQFQLLLQFICESLGLTTISLVVASMILIGTSRYLGEMLSVDVIDLMISSKDLFLTAIVAMIFAVVISPVFMVIRFIRASPIRLLSSDAITFPRFKQIISVVQFGVSIFLIVSSILISRQINYSLIKEPGRNHDQIVYMACPPNIPDSAVHKIKAGWPNKNPNVLDAVAISQLPNRLQSKEVGSDLFVLEVDYNFRDFFQFEMLKGDWFEYTDRDSVIVVNTEALRTMGDVDRHLIGVIQDINSPFNQPEQPVKIRHARETTHNWICFRVEEVDVRNTIKWIEGRMHAKGSPGKAYFYDEHFVEWLTYQDRLNALSRTLIVISIILAGCAIYGLIVSLVRDKMKVIAVHHVLGAGLSPIVGLLARGLVWHLLLALFFFGPLTYIFLNELLRTFVYATEFSWLDPVYPVLFSVVAIIGLCCYQALRLNRSNLVSTLKS